jgi:hypothetical protein
MAVCSRLCVYCGSKVGADPGFAALARELGARCAADGVEIVFGGGSLGLMGELASAARDAGGCVTGIIPRHLQRLEIAHDGLSELIVVESMHARKQQMAERADAFCVLPGGIGSLDEAIEIITWKQLGLHDKPVVFVDHDGYWQPLFALFRHQRDQGFMSATHRHLFDVAPDIDGLFAAIARAPAAALGLDSART